MNPISDVGAADDQVDRARLTFIRTMTRAVPSLVVWKHLDRALRGVGDIDCVVDERDLDVAIATAFAAGAESLDASTVVECRHVADKVLLFFVQESKLPQLFELDLTLQPSRGLGPWARSADILGRSEVDDTGVRRLSSGAEAVVSLVYHGLSARGVDRLHGVERAICRSGLDKDLQGALEACRTMAPALARRPLLGVVGAMARGEWSRGWAVGAWWAFVLSGLAHPGFVVRHLIFRLRLASSRDCVMSDLARRHGRRVDPQNLASLLLDARESGHGVVELVPHTG